MTFLKEHTMKKIIHTLLPLLLLANFSKAQQDPMFTHYMYNTLWLNPAYAGSREMLTMTGIHRSQWVGFDGAPQDQTFTLHSPLMNGKLGLGMTLMSDRIGPTRSSVAALDFAYHLKLSEKSKLSFGLKGLLNIYNNNLSALTLDQGNDASFAQNVQSVLPNVGTGVYYYRERFYLGLSTPKLLENQFTASGSAPASKEQRHFFMIMGGVMDLTSTLKLKPTMFIKATNGAPIQGDFTASLLIKDKFSVGAMYRTGDGAGALIGYNITPQLLLGYSYDWSLANTSGKYNSGSHELMLRYDLIYKSKGNITSPRYF